MGTLRHQSSRSVLTSILALLAASALIVTVVYPPEWSRQQTPRLPVETRGDATEISADRPENHQLVGQLASPRTDLTREIGRVEGAEGLRTLDLFGDEAGDLFRIDPGSFHELAGLLRLDRALLEASAGPWRKAVLEWAGAGKLAPYRERLIGLDAYQRGLLTATPGCLPLLGRGATKAEAMLSRHGGRAWQLFLTQDFAEDLSGVERVAEALAIHGERMLRVNESHGPLLALLFVPSREDLEGHLPRLFDEAIDRLGVDEAGALFLANRDDLERLVLEEGRTPGEISGVLGQLAGQPEAVRVLASDSGRVVRLLLERRGKVPIGVEILTRCGPEAGDLLFERGGYAGHPQERVATTAILARRGWPAVELLRTFRDDEPWHHLLRRVDLLDDADEPLIVRLAGKLEISSSRQEDIERYLSMPKRQIVGLDLPSTTAEKALEWVPGYLAAHTTYDLARGYRVEDSVLVEALYDGVTTTLLVGKLLNVALKTVGKQVPKLAARNLATGTFTELVKNRGRRATGKLVNSLPGVLRTMVGELRKDLPKLDVTAVIRWQAGIAKKLGLKTWGKLDRRIIMRGDRIVIIDLSDPKVLSLIGEKVRDETIEKLRERAIAGLQWSAIALEVGELGPCLMEQVDHALRSSPEELSDLAKVHASPPLLRPVVARAMPSRVVVHPAFTPLGTALIAACLILAVPRARAIFSRRLDLEPPGRDRKPRRYEE